MEWGYLKILIYPSSRLNIALFGVYKNIKLENMLMGSHNAAPVFAAMMGVVHAGWQEKYYKRCIPDTCLEVIIYYVMIFMLLIAALINYLEVGLDVLSH